jgi:phage gp45-like
VLGLSTFPLFLPFSDWISELFRKCGILCYFFHFITYLLKQRIPHYRNSTENQSENGRNRGKVDSPNTHIYKTEGKSIALTHIYKTEGKSIALTYIYKTEGKSIALTHTYKTEVKWIALTHIYKTEGKSIALTHTYKTEVKWIALTHIYKTE